MQFFSPFVSLSRDVFACLAGLLVNSPAFNSVKRFVESTPKFLLCNKKKELRKSAENIKIIKEISERECNSFVCLLKAFLQSWKGRQV